MSWQEVLDSSCTFSVSMGTYFSRPQQLLFKKIYFCQTDLLHLPSGNLILSTLSGLGRTSWKCYIQGCLNGSWGDFMTSALAEASLPCRVPPLWREWNHQWGRWTQQLCPLHTITNSEGFPVPQKWHGLKHGKHCPNSCLWWGSALHGRAFLNAN